MDWIWCGLRVCLNCGSWNPGPSGLCEFCLCLLPEARPQTILTAKNIRVHFLFQWVPGESDSLSRLLRGLKGGRRREAWTFWARRFSQTRPQFENAKTTFIPSPSAKPCAKDHAALWTEALSAYAGGRIRAGDLRLRKEEEQKELSRLERWRTRRVVNMTGWTPPRGGRIIVGDDVLTTGTTAWRIYEALGKPRRFEVWTLAYRSEGPLRTLGRL